MSHQTILVLDFGSQYTQLIARRLRELSVYSEVVPFNTSLDTIRAKDPAGLILSGGPSSVSDPGAPKCDAAIFGLDDVGEYRDVVRRLAVHRVVPSSAWAAGVQPASLYVRQRWRPARLPSSSPPTTSQTRA